MPAVAVIVALGAAVVAALLTGQRLSPVSGGVESASAASAGALARLVRALPLGYAVGAGMVAAVNPCGFAMLPGYLALFLGSESSSQNPPPPRGSSRWLHALQISAAVTVSFILLFGVAGLLLSLVTSSIARYLPWAGLAVGILMIIAAGRLLAGGNLYTSLGAQAADRLAGGARRHDIAGYFVYGLAYAIASLSCTLPIFLVVVAGGLTAGFLGGAVQFVLYALGMGVVITAFTLSAALFKNALLARVRQAGRFIEPVSAFLLLAAGAYIIYYWLTIGGLLRH